MAVRSPIRMIVRPLVCIVLSSLAQGCYRSEDAFVRRAAKISCVQAKHCFPDEFAQMFDTMGDCRDDFEAELQNTLAFELESCEYQPEAGRACIRRLYANRHDCDPQAEDFGDDCNGVFLCPREGTVDADASFDEAVDVVLPAPLRSEG